jgi:hypothetical protein
MAHIEDLSKKPANTLAMNGDSVSFFACGIGDTDHSHYTIVRLDDNDNPVDTILASTGTLLQSYKKSLLDPDLVPYFFTISGVHGGDKIVIRYDGANFSEPAFVIDAATMKNQWLMQHAPEDVKRANLLYASGDIEPLSINGEGPMHPSPHGLALHVTAGETDAKAQVRTWGRSGVGAHFIIERSGRIVQCVALSLAVGAQGDRGKTPGNANAHWFSVEVVCQMNDAGTDGHFVSIQLTSCRQLFRDLQTRYGFKNGLAAPLVNDDGEFGRIARILAARYDLTGVTSREDAGKSLGLSCHRWLGLGHTCPGLLGLKNLPVVLGDDAVHGDEFQDLVGRWTVTINDKDWDYVCDADGRARWTDPSNQATGEGTWTITNASIHIEWPSGTIEDWTLPIDETAQTGTCTMAANLRPSGSNGKFKLKAWKEHSPLNLRKPLWTSTGTAEPSP